MTITLERPKGCLEPIEVDPVVDNPDAIRALARANGPYFMPARYLVDGASADDASDGQVKKRENVPDYLIGAVWRGDWCTGGKPLIDGVDHLLHHEGFTEAAKQMCDAQVIVPEQVFVNLNTPMPGSAFSHVDIPEFVGMDRSNTPGWMLISMGASGAFEDVRITIVTAVAWFYQGERGYFRFWPHGRDAPSVRHEKMWNSAVVGDNDFMHHQVERVGPQGATPPEGMTIDTSLDFDGDRWNILEEGSSLASYSEDQVRLSLSWKAKAYATADVHQAAQQGDAAMTLDIALHRLAAVIDEPLAATGPDAIHSPELRAQLSARFMNFGGRGQSELL